MSRFSNVNRVIFDLDNTLIKHNFDRENNCIAKHFGLEESDEFRTQLNRMFSENIEYLKGGIVTKKYFISVIEKLMPILRDIGKTGQDLLDVIDEYHSGTLMEGAVDLLEYLSLRGYQIVALTNWFYYYQVNILNKLGIAEYFERIYAWDDYYPKPNLMAMNRALENTNPKNNIVIGDDALGDITLAKSCGVYAIGFNVDYSRYKNIIVADENVTRLVDIKKYL